MTAIGVVVMALVIGLSVWAIAVNSRPHSTRGDRGDGGEGSFFVDGGDSDSGGDGGGDGGGGDGGGGGGGD